MAKRKKKSNIDIYTANQGYQAQDYYESKSLTGKNTSEVRRVRVGSEQQEKLFSVSSKGKWVLFGLLVGLVLLGGLGYFLYSEVIGTSDIILKSDTIEAELGTDIVLDTDLVLNTQAMNKWAVGKVGLDTALTVDGKYDYDSTSKIVKTKGMGYLMEGEYPIRVRLGNQEKLVMLVVKDTTNPKITGLSDTLTVEQNAQALKIESFFTVSDFNKTQVKIDGNYDLKKAGEYTINVVAEDTSGNKISQPLTLRVLSSKEAQQSPEKLSQTVEGTTPVSLATEKKIVAGKLSDISNPVGYEGNEIKKGTYSNPDTQRKLEEEKRRKEAEAKAKEEAKETQSQGNTANNNNNNNYTPNQGNQGYNGNTNQNQGNTGTSNYTPPKRNTGSKPVGDYVDEHGKRHYDLFTTVEGARALMKWYKNNGQGARMAGGCDLVTGEYLGSYDGKMLYKVYPE